MCPDDILINNYIDGLLSEEERVNIEAHLDVCKVCSHTVKALSLYSNSIASIRDEKDYEVSDSFLDSIFSKIDAIEHPSFEEISLYYDGQTDLISFNKIKNHLEECSPCEKTYNNIKAQANIISNVPEYNLDDNFMNSLFNKIDNLNLDIVENHISFEDLSSYVDNENNYIDNKHLDTCDICNDNYQSILNTKKMVSSLKTPVLPIDFSKRVIEKIEEHEEKIIPFKRQKEGIFSRMSIAAGLLVISLLIPVSRTIISDRNNETIITASVDKNTKIEVRSEDLLFSSSDDFKKDSFEIISEGRKEDSSLEIEDIGL